MGAKLGEPYNRIFCDAAVNTILRGLDPQTGKSFTKAQKSAILRKVAKASPASITEAIDGLEAKIALLRLALQESPDAQS